MAASSVVQTARSYFGSLRCEILITNMGNVSSRVAELATMIGIEGSNTPYVSQSTRPQMKHVIHMPDMSCVRRVRKVFRSCGTKETVVNVPAASPMMVK